MNDLSDCAHKGHIKVNELPFARKKYRDKETALSEPAQMTWWQRFEKARKNAGLSRAEVARRIGTSREAVQKYASGAVENPRGDTMRNIAKAVGTTEEWLRLGQISQAPLSQMPNAKILTDITSPPLREEMERDIPVMGSATGGPDGALNMGEPHDMARRPPALKNAKDVFAVEVSGDSMEPRLFPGDTLFVSARKTARIGDLVVVQCRMNNGEQDQPLIAFVKVLSGNKSGKPLFIQYNPDGPWIPPGPIQSVDRVYPWSELLPLY